MIWPYEPLDLEACRGLWQELTERHRLIFDDPTIGGDNPGAFFDQHLAKPTIVGTWVAACDSEVIGMCSLLVSGEEGEIDPVVVRAADRSQGVGRRLLEHAIEEAKRRGVRFLGIRPVARNVEAMELYHDIGFHVLGQIEMFMYLGTEPGEWGPGVSIHGMEFDY